MSAASEAAVDSPRRTAELPLPPASERAQPRSRAASAPPRGGRRAGERRGGGTGMLTEPYHPAAWEGRDYYSEKVDVWQAGCLLHELLCGSMPFEVRPECARRCTRLQPRRPVCKSAAEPCGHNLQHPLSQNQPTYPGA
jgi:serine/threonine protein kinase